VLNKNDRQSRNPLFDLLRIILIILVVNIHIRMLTHGQPNNLEYFGFYAVPLFMTLSFFLMSKYFSQIRLSFTFILLRIKRLIIPLIFWSLIGFLVHPELINIKNIFIQLMTGELVNVPLYYLNLLICFTFLFWLITHLPPRFKIFIYIGIILIVFCLEYSRINFNFFYPMSEAIKKSYGRFTELIKYASLGLIFGLLEKQNKKKIIIFGLAGFSLISLIAFNLPQPYGFHYSGIELFLGTILTFSLINLISQDNLKFEINKIISIFGSYTLGIYLFHYVLLEAILRIFPLLKPLIKTNQIPFLFLYMTICYLICFLFDFLTRKRLSFLIR
jgi:peptidoglycan/LPS O-acetylase OafA/YrhL